MSHILHTLCATGILVLIALMGCESGPTPEELRADSTLTAARESHAQGLVREAQAMLRNSLALEQGLGRSANSAALLTTLGESHARVGEFDTARTYFLRAADVYRSLADRRSATARLLDIGSMDRMMDEERKVYQFYSEALRLARVFKDDTGVHDLQWALLPVLRTLEYRDQERALLEELLARYTAGGDLRGRARVAYESGLMEALHANDGPAMQQFLGAVTLAGQAGDSVLLVRAMTQVAVLADARGKTGEALQRYADALRVAYALPAERKLTASILLRVGNAYRLSKDDKNAVRFYRAALSYSVNAKDRISEGYCMVLIGLTGAPGPESGKSIESGLALFEGAGEPRAAAFARTALGLAHERSRRPVQAMDAYRAAIEWLESSLTPPDPSGVFESCERAALGGPPTIAYDRLAALLLQTGKHDEALGYAERSARRQAHLLFTQTEPRIRDSTFARELDAYRGAVARRIGAERQYRRCLEDGGTSPHVVRSARQTLDQAGSSVTEIRDRLARPAGPYAPLLGIEGVRVADLQRRLPPGTLLVRYIPTDKTLYAVTVSATRSSAGISAVSSDELYETAAALTGLFRSYESESDSTLTETPALRARADAYLRTLGEWLTRPISRELSSASRVIIVTTPELPWLPVHALRTGRSSRASYLAQQVKVHYLPFAGALLFPVQANPAVRDVAALGFPGRTAWDVEYELRDIRAFYKDARLYFGKQATLDQVRSEGAHLLHIAAAVSVSTIRPGNSVVTLSDGKSATSSRAAPVGEFLSLPAIPGLVFSNLSPGGTLQHVSIPTIGLMNGTSGVVMNGYVPLRRSKKFFAEVFYTALLSGVAMEDAYRAVQIEMIRTPAYASPLVWGQYFYWGR